MNNYLLPPFILEYNLIKLIFNILATAQKKVIYLNKNKLLSIK